MNRHPEVPHITIEGTKDQSIYFLDRRDSRLAIDGAKFRVIRILNQYAPGLVYVSNIIGPSIYNDYSAYQQTVAERMHQLSQPEALGDLLQPEVYRVHIVGYRLMQTIGFVDNRQIVAPKADRPGGLRRLLSQWLPI